MRKNTLKEQVRKKYADAAERARKGASSCCGERTAESAITKNLYKIGELEGIPDAARLASLGCGNPSALATLRPGEVVLDLGSGGGIDVLLSARRVGPTGKAYGLDMTDEMLALAKENQRKAGVENVEFLKGELEAIPLPDECVDVVISNCVINLSLDKDRALREAFRVLRPGGRFAVSDIVLEAKLPERIAKDVRAWTSCIAGALTRAEYQAKLAGTGFVDISVEPTRVYSAKDLAGSGCCSSHSSEDLAAIDGKIMSAFIRATKPHLP